MQCRFLLVFIFLLHFHSVSATQSCSEVKLVIKRKKINGSCIQDKNFRIPEFYTPGKTKKMLTACGSLRMDSAIINCIVNAYNFQDSLHQSAIEFCIERLKDNTERFKDDNKECKALLSLFDISVDDFTKTVEKNLTKELLKKHSTFMDDLFEKGYARRLPN